MMSDISPMFMAFEWVDAVAKERDEEKKSMMKKSMIQELIEIPQQIIYQNNFS